MKRPREAGTRPHDLRRDPADDCETPLEAYVHVAFVLSKISQKKNVRKSALRVYDPYFCAGAASERLRALGFASASNEDVDFYAALGDTQSRVDDGSTNAPSLPAHDVLVTNPPFSGDHCRRLVAFLAARPRDKPFALLAPALRRTSRPPLPPHRHRHCNLCGPSLPAVAAPPITAASFPLPRLAGCNIQDAGASSLATALATNSTLATLNLGA